MGRMTTYENAVCQITAFQMATDQGDLVQATCDAFAVHQRATANYRLNILKRQGEWKILGIFVIPEEQVSGPVQVSLPPAGARYIGISVNNISIGGGVGVSLQPGASVYSAEKIENIN